jgi:hypothetical protein
MAITLMAFVMVLCLALLALSRVETTASKNAETMELARQNARLGMMAALAQLQKTAGPDQRVSAPASLLDTNPSTAAIDGVAHPYWTGIWQDSNPADHRREFVKPGESSPIPSSDRKTAVWLVSGTNPDPLSSLPATKSIRLVDKGSVSAATGYVDAEKMEIRDTTLPSGKVTGHYAYWVGDEGIKAKITLSNPYAAAGSGTPEKVFSQTLSQRNAGEAVSGFDAKDAGEFVLTQKSADMPKLLSTRTLSLLHNSFETSQKDRFHDITTCSFGLLTDTRWGGLKKDLTLAFESPDTLFDAGELAADFANSGERNTPGTGGGAETHDLGYVFAFERPSAASKYQTPDAANWSNTASRKFRGPTWHYLRSYYRLYKDVDTDSSGTPSLKARPILPSALANSSVNPNPVSKTHSIPYNFYRSSDSDSDVFTKSKNNNLYVFGTTYPLVNVLRPTGYQVAPSLARIMFLYSIGRENGRLAFYTNVFAVVYNPYNVSLRFRGFKINLEGQPLSIGWRSTDPANPSGPVPDYYYNIDSTSKAFSESHNWYETTQKNSWETGSFGGVTQPWSCLSMILTADGTASPKADKVLAPGELALVSMGQSSPTDYTHGQTAQQSWNVDSGMRMNTFFKSPNWTTIPVSDTSKNWFVMRFNTSNGFTVNLFQTPDDLSAASNSWSSSHTQDGLLGTTPMPWYQLAAPPQYFFVGGAKDSDPYVTGAELDTGSNGKRKYAIAMVDCKLIPPAQDFAAAANGNPAAALPSAVYFKSTKALWEGEIREISGGNINDVVPDNDTATYRAYWGPGVDAATGFTQVPFLEVPRQPLVSLGQLGSLVCGLYGSDPLLAIGNSYAHPMVDRANVYNLVSGRSYADLSYLMNESLWDSFYFSTLVPANTYGTAAQFQSAVQDNAAKLADSGQNFILPNSRLRFITGSAKTPAAILGELSNHRKAASNLKIDGAFNVNSTSPEAWKAVLSGLRQQHVQYSSLAGVPSLTGLKEAFFSRFAFPFGQDGDTPEEKWRGFVSLSAGQVSSLAEKLVEQVKSRGPFTSLGDFVNRRLATDESGLEGPLQAAIDATGINARMAQGTPSTPSGAPNPLHRAADKAAGIPGYLMQSDILKALGPSLSARSDTFLIRAYGDVQNKATGRTEGKAWCEAIVQRLPEPVQPSAANPLEPADPSLYGRRFVIVSFRYLGPDEI